LSIDDGQENVRVSAAEEDELSSEADVYTPEGGAWKSRSEIKMAQTIVDMDNT
jgi:hypothetical protein